MRYRVLAAGMWFVFSCNAVATDAAPSSLDFDVSATVDVSADGNAHVVEIGKVSKLSSVPALVPVADQVAQKLRDRIASWQFVPATRDGVAVPSRTHVYVFMRAGDDGRGGLAVTILSASPGAVIRKRPMGELVGALVDFGPDSYVLAEIHYAADGDVIDVEVREQRTLSGGRFVPTSADSRLRKGIRNALRRWTFDPEIVDGTPIEGHGLLPMFYCNSPACDEARAGMDAPHGEAFASADSAVKLRTAVAGTAL